MTTTPVPPPAVLAIDAGQSSIRSQLGAGPVHSFAGIRTDLPLAPQLASVVEQSLRDLGVSDLTVAAGVSGIPGGVDGAEQALAQQVAELVELHGVSRVLVAHDSITAYLGALSAELGAVVAAGTGVVTLAVGEAEVARVDGWGYLIGDAGSGYWIGRAALDAVMRAYDGRGPETALTEVVQARHPLLGPMHLTLQTDEGRVKHIASFSKAVGALAETDAVAAGILESAAAELATAVASGLRKVGLGTTDAPVQVRGIGAVFASPHLSAAFAKRMGELIPSAVVAIGESHPLDGAAVLPNLGPGHALSSRIGVGTSLDLGLAGTT